MTGPADTTTTTTDAGGSVRTPFTNRDLIKGAPNTAVVVAVTVVAVAVLGAFVLLILGGKDTAALTTLIDRVVGLLAALSGAGGLVYGASAARSASAAERQTNGSLDARMAEAVAAGIARALDGEPPSPAAPTAAPYMRGPEPATPPAAAA